jgi:hypothetical protein
MMIVGRACRASFALSGVGGGTESVPSTALATSKARCAPDACSRGSEASTTSRADGICASEERPSRLSAASPASSSIIVA